MGERKQPARLLRAFSTATPLRAMMNGGKDDDIMTALANSLDNGTKVDAAAAWKKVSAEKSAPIEKLPERPKRTRLRAAQGFLFDIAPSRPARFA